MRRTLVVLVSLLAGLAFTMAPAGAIPPDSTERSGGLHFVGQPDLTVGGSLQDGVFLRVRGEVAGAGPTATATLTATADYTTGCVNRGSKGQEPSGLQRSFTDVAVSDTFPTRSGRGSFDLSTETITAADRTCPDRMRPVLVSVEFTNVRLTVTSQTGTTTATFPDVTFP